MLSEESLRLKYKEIDNFDPDKVKEQQYLIADEVLYKMDDFRMDRPSTTTIMEYITREYTKKSDFYYDFVQETDNATLKVLIQLLYDQLESFCINMTILDDSKNFYQKKYENFLKEDSSTNLKNSETKLQMDNHRFQDECEQLRFQLEEKNELVDGLFAEKQFYVKSNNELSVLFKQLENFFTLLGNNDCNDTDRMAGVMDKLQEDVKSMDKFLCWTNQLNKHNNTPNIKNQLSSLNDVLYYFQSVLDNDTFNKHIIGDFEGSSNLVQDLVNDYIQKKADLLQANEKITEMNKNIADLQNKMIRSPWDDDRLFDLEKAMERVEDLCLSEVNANEDLDAKTVISKQLSGDDSDQEDKNISIPHSGQSSIIVPQYEPQQKLSSRVSGDQVKADIIPCVNSQVYSENMLDQMDKDLESGFEFSVHSLADTNMNNFNGAFINLSQNSDRSDTEESSEDLDMDKPRSTKYKSKFYFGRISANSDKNSLSNSNVYSVRKSEELGKITNKYHTKNVVHQEKFENFENSQHKESISSIDEIEIITEDNYETKDKFEVDVDTITHKSETSTSKKSEQTNNLKLEINKPTLTM